MRACVYVSLSQTRTHSLSHTHTHTRAKDGEAEEPARVAGASAAGRKGTRPSEKAKVSEEALLTKSSKAKKPMNA
jgi:hypothetical protein